MVIAEDEPAYFSLVDHVLSQFRANVRDYDGDPNAYYAWRGNVEQAFLSAQSSFKDSRFRGHCKHEWAFVSIAAAALTGDALEAYQAEIIPCIDGSTYSEDPHFDSFLRFLFATDRLFGIPRNVARERLSELFFSPPHRDNLDIHTYTEWRKFRTEWLKLSNISQYSPKEEYKLLFKAIRDDCPQKARLIGLEGASIRDLLDAAGKVPEQK